MRALGAWGILALLVVGAIVGVLVGLPTYNVYAKQMAGRTAGPGGAGCPV